MEPMQAENLAREMWKVGEKYAQAKAQAIQMEQWVKSCFSKQVIVYKDRKMSVAEAEHRARMSDEWHTSVEAHAAAVEEMERLRWQLSSIQVRLDLYRTETATRREEIKRLGG